jgi:hypothetical protein
VKVRLVPDFLREASPLRCACGITPQQGFLVISMDGRASIVLPPRQPVDLVGPPCIVRVQARVRQRLAHIGVERHLTGLARSQLWTLSEAVAAAAIAEFGFVERMMTLCRDVKVGCLFSLRPWNLW